MIRDGLFTRFPKPDVAVALHVGNEYPAGMVAITPGVYNTNSDSIRITIYGKGGHGASPHTTVDPIVIAARTVLTLQTIASREVKPGELAIVTIGYLRAGTKNNIIPDQAEMGLTVRTFKSDVRQQVLAAITRITKAEAAAAGAPREPSIDRYEGTDSVYNDPALAERLRAPLEAALGKDKVVTGEPITPSEDFSYFVEQGVPGFYFSCLGGAGPGEVKRRPRPRELSCRRIIRRCSLRMWIPRYAPPGITAEVAVLRNLLNTSADELHKLTAEKPSH